MFCTETDSTGFCRTGLRLNLIHSVADKLDPTPLRPSNKLVNCPDPGSRPREGCAGPTKAALREVGKVVYFSSAPRRLRGLGVVCAQPSRGHVQGATALGLYPRSSLGGLGCWLLPGFASLRNCTFASWVASRRLGSG
jgi:hypothetical protein